ncbi:hypothetical protein [Runella sp.]|uniref:hypothetical protein n=1 Tax=Runella sp. TaxID=1960881 RepID=UPI003D0C9FDF
MIFLGNNALTLTSVCHFSFSSMVEQSTPSDNYMAVHSFLLLLSVTGFVVCMFVIAGAIFKISGLDWISKQPMLRTTFVVPSLIAILLISFLSRGEAPWIVQLLGKKAAVWLLIPLLTAGTVILTTTFPKSPLPSR